MLRNSIVFALLLIGILVSIQCTNDRSLPNGFEALDRESKGDVQSIKLKPVRMESYWSLPAAGERNTMMIGAYEGIESDLIVQAASLGNIDTATVTSAVLTLDQLNQWGTGDSMQVDIFPVTASWREKERTIKWPDIENNIDFTRLAGSFKIGPKDTTAQLNITIDPAIVNDWIKTGTDNGLIFRARDAQFMAVFLSYESDQIGNLMKVKYKSKSKAGAVDSVNLNMVFDASLLRAKTQIPENILLSNQPAINSAMGFRTILKFDFSTVPKDATFNYADLTLYVDKANSDTKYYGTSVLLSPISSETEGNPAATTFDANFTAPETIAIDDAEKFRFGSSSAITNIVGIIQAYTLDYLPNNGFVLRAKNEGEDLSKISFFTGQSDSTLAPTLTLYYSLPPSSRFSKR